MQYISNGKKFSPFEMYCIYIREGMNIMTKKFKKLVEDNKDLDSALSALDTALDLSKLEGYSKDAIERAAKSIQYTIKGELGCNYYTYGFHKDDLINKSLIVKWQQLIIKAIAG